nr:sterol desaturase family protein [Acanthopleuribacter pedis]
MAVEFAYYWYHRFSHEIPFLWAIHHAHHSSTHMNLTTAVRLNWMGGFVSIPFFMPLVLLGLSPNMIVTALALNLLFQFFLHTEAIGKLGKLEGALINTPAAHRVHHGTNPAYIDKNYGGVLIIFDRLFGTWEPEQEQVRYGVTTGPVRSNPFVIVFAPMRQWLRGAFFREKHTGRPGSSHGRVSASANRNLADGMTLVSAAEHVEQEMKTCGVCE